MATVTVPQDRTSGNGEIANTDSAKSSPNEIPVDADNERAGAVDDSEYDGGVQEWRISDLKPHQLQGDFFPAESEEADRELAADMEANGQKVPIDILPDGTILGGHRRVAAAKRLGWTHIEAIVHIDLADDKDAAEAFFINDNCIRRQLTELQKVRCAARRVELAKLGKVALPKECNGLNKTRDKIGKLLEISGREADRYLRVLKTPIEVQHAQDAGHLSLAEAGKVADLTEELQACIAEEIREQGPEQAKAIVRSHLPPKAATRRGAKKVWFDLRYALKDATEELPGNFGKIGRMDHEDLDLIEVAEQLIEDLKEHALDCLRDDDDELDESDTGDLVLGNNIAGVLERATVDIVSTEDDE